MRFWPTVARLGAVQAAIGAVVVIMTSTLNRVLVVELALPAIVPGALVGLHFLVQLGLRPRLGFGSDQSARRTPWIMGGMVVLAAGAVGASASTLVMSAHPRAGLLVAVVAFILLGAGVSAAGTSLLALVAELVPAQRRAVAAAVVWLMMISGFVVTTILVSVALDPFSLRRLVLITAAAAGVAVVIALLALVGIEPRAGGRTSTEPAPTPDFADAFRAVWADPHARVFTLFVFVSMLAYSAQDLILEPFAGRMFALSPSASTRISSLHQGGMLVGMLVAGGLAVRWGSLRGWAAAGCAASAVAFGALALTPASGSVGHLQAAILGLGLANGCFAIGAVGSMMGLAVTGERRTGVRMGVFGAAQAVAYALGGFAGAAGSDAAAAVLGSPGAGYAAVFVAEALLFLVSARLALASGATGSVRTAVAQPEAGDSFFAAMN